MSNAGDSPRVDDVLASIGNMNVEEGQLVCQLLELSSKAGAHSDGLAVVVTSHYAHVGWLRHCVDFVGKCLALVSTLCYWSLLLWVGSKGCKAESSWPPCFPTL